MIDVNAYLGHFAFRQLRHNTGDSLVRLMDRFGIERSVVSSAAAITYRNSQAGNGEVASEIRSHRPRLIPFAVLNPAYSGWKDDLKICREQFGMTGVRLYPAWHGYSLADSRCRDLVNAAAELRMTISIPMRVEDRRQQSWLVDVPDLKAEEIAGLIRACPKARFIVANATSVAGSILGRKDNALPPNYAIEITWLRSAPFDEIPDLLASLGEDRLLFGTGIPFHYPGSAIAKIEILQIPETVKAKIRKQNAVRWLSAD
jgi:uncharacterized protein